MLEFIAKVIETLLSELGEAVDKLSDQNDMATLIVQETAPEAANEGQGKGNKRAKNK